jgi:hypothetical protein
MDLAPAVYERQEREKQDLQRVLAEQIEEKRRRQEQDRRKRLLEE